MNPCARRTMSSGRNSWWSFSAVRGQIMVLLCAGVSAAGFLYASDPTHESLFPDCLLLSRMGLYCAGCGVTRALHALLHGRVLEAVHDNAMLVMLLPRVLYSLATDAI